MFAVLSPDTREVCFLFLFDALYKSSELVGFETASWRSVLSSARVRLEQSQLLALGVLLKNYQRDQSLVFVFPIVHKLRHGELSIQLDQMCSCIFLKLRVGKKENGQYLNPVASLINEVGRVRRTRFRTAAETVCKPVQAFR